MCGRFTLTAGPEELLQVFNVAAMPPDYRPRYNIAPSQDLLAILKSGGKNHFEYLHWGFVPFWAKDPSIGNRMINARSETLDTKKSFKAPFRKSRCLIAADGFYEWRKQGTRKIPVYIFLKPKRLFAFAGLWSEWESPEGEMVRSCTLITTEANQTLKSIHERMPVILNECDYDIWLDPNNRDTEILKDKFVPYDDKGMDNYEVSSFVNRPDHEGVECTERV